MTTNESRWWVVLAAFALLLGCETEGAGGVADGAAGDAFGDGSGDGSGDFSEPPADLLLRPTYRFDPERSTCASSFSPWSECITATYSGDDVMFYTASVVVTGRWDGADVTLDAPRLAVGEGSDVVLDACRAPLAVAQDREALAFDCVREDVPCTFALDAAPSCRGPAPRLVTDAMVDPSGLVRVSRYNSCVGHDWGCPLAQGCFASLKLYLVPGPQFANTADRYALWAPCDGFVSRFEPEQNRLPCHDGDFRGYQVHVDCDGEDDIGVVFFHVTPLDGVEAGVRVLSGDPLGFADVRACGDPEPSFDIAVLRDRVAVFPFDYLTDEALAPWRVWGLPDPADPVRLSDAERGPCTFDREAPPDHWFAPE